MRYSTIAGAALLTPAVFASPLNARQAGVPTCNPNNVRALGQQKPKSTGFCTNWFKTTTTKHVAPVTVTGLSEAQITNLCSCILAPTYVSGRPLTSLEPTSTQGSTTAAQTSSTTPAITSSVASSTTTSSSASATPTGCVNGDTAAAADGAIYTKYCDSALDGGIGQSFSVGSLANCQAKCTDSTCKGFVYTAASRSCLLYTSVDGPYDSAGSTALVYKSGRGSSSSSTTSGASSSTSASSSLSSSAAGSSSSSASSSAVSSSTTSSTTTGPASAPSVFNIYLASSPSATSGGSILRYPAANVEAGIYPTPTPNVVKRQTTDACTSGPYAANGNNYQRVCKVTIQSGATLSVADEQPDKEDNITNLAGCIEFCAKKGVDANGKQNCKAVGFDPAGLPASSGAANTACKLYSSIPDNNLPADATGTKSAAYLVGDVPVGIFTFDRNTGYVYNNDSTTGTQLCGLGADATVDTKLVKANSILNGKLSADCNPLVCEVDAQLRLTCKFTANGVIYDKTNLNPEVAIDPTTKVARMQALKLTTGASSKFSMYIAAPIATVSSPAVYSNGNEKSLLVASDLINSAQKVTAGKSSVNLTPAGSLNMTFALDGTATGFTAPVTLFKDFPVYAKDTYRFIASLSLDNGRLIDKVTCTASFFLDGTISQKAVTIDKTYPSNFDLLFEGSFVNTKTTTASFDVTCASGDANNLGPAITIPITVSNLKLSNNPALPSSYEIVGTTAGSYAAFAPFYSGSGSLIPDGKTPATSTAINGNTVFGPTILYVGQSTSNQGAAVKACAASTAKTNPVSTMFEVYFDTNDSFWKCNSFSMSLPSKTLFSTGYAPALANVNSVSAYYKSVIIPFPA